MLTAMTALLESKSCHVFTFFLLIVSSTVGCNKQNGEAIVVNDVEKTVDLTDKNPDPSELENNLGKRVKVKGIAIEEKGYGDISTVFGKVVISGEHIWDRGIVGSEVIVEGVLHLQTFGTPAPEKKGQWPPQSSLPAKLFVLENMTWDSMADRAAENSHTEESLNPFFD